MPSRSSLGTEIASSGGDSAATVATPSSRNMRCTPRTVMPRSCSNTLIPPTSSMSAGR
jgi:hypothetical protein